jgi:hypothetical protein
VTDEYARPRPEWNLSGADHDLPYQFGRRVEHYVLKARERVQLVLLRGRLDDRHLLRHRRGADTEGHA